MNSEVINNAPNTDNVSIPCRALIFGRNESVTSCLAAGHDQLSGRLNVGQRKENLPLAFVLGGSAVAGFPVTKEFFDDVERMLNTHPSAGLYLLDILLKRFGFAVSKFLDLAALAGHTCQSKTLPTFSGRLATPV
jgi:hypothetical protein